MSTFVRTLSHSHLAKSLDEYPRRECKPVIRIVMMNLEFVNSDDTREKV